MAAKIKPRRGRVKSSSLEDMKICWNSHELVFIASQAIARMRPTSPTRLYNTAWSAAAFASVRPLHQPMRRKDIMPTPSQPMKS